MVQNGLGSLEEGYGLVPSLVALQFIKIEEMVQNKYFITTLFCICINQS
jgi:hypothetical protein